MGLFKKKKAKKEAEAKAKLEAEAKAKKEAEAKAAPKKAEPKKDEKADLGKRVYHVVKREEDGKWAVKFAGGEKVIKLFDTQEEAKAYTKQMAENQGGAMLVHNSKGANKGKIKKK